jgi:protein gp37
LAEVKVRLAPLFTFGSFEPLLGRITLDRYAPDWIIAGGETDQGSHKARPTDPDTFRYLRNQAIARGRSFFMKQMTRKAPIPDDLLIRQWPIERRAA